MFYVQDLSGVVRPVLDMLLLSFVYCIQAIGSLRLFPLRLYFDSCYDIYTRSPHRGFNEDIQFVKDVDAQLKGNELRCEAPSRSMAYTGSRSDDIFLLCTPVVNSEASTRQRSSITASLFHFLGTLKHAIRRICICIVEIYSGSCNRFFFSFDTLYILALLLA
jgi:hypothetical protein